MSKGLFQSPKKAGLFAGATILAVVLLVGSEDQQGALVQAAATVESSAVQSRPQDQFNPDPQPIRQVREPAQVEEPVTWIEDDDLIDDTSGFDPSPEEFDPAEGDMYIIEDEF